MPTTPKPPIYLLDSMAFIFRAYHAMQRSRPMTTRTGIPTAATYVFVNMINKLRADFHPSTWPRSTTSARRCCGMKSLAS
jgi:DNA polymerase-1